MVNCSKAREARFWQRWRASGAVGTYPPIPSLAMKHKALQLFMNQRYSHTQALAAIGLPRDRQNNLLWQWGREFQQQGLIKNNQLLPLPTPTPGENAVQRHCQHCDAELEPNRDGPGFH